MSFSPASLNLLGRSRAGAMSPDGASLLAALIALGVVDGDERWFNAHRPGPLHEQAIEALTVARFRKGKGDAGWKQPEAKALLTAAERLSQEPEWLRGGTGEKIRGLLA